MNNCFVWWRHFLRAPKRAGSVLPSSRRLAERIAREVSGFDGEPVTLIEVGAGTGAVTEALLRLPYNQSATLVEADAACCAHLRRRFPRARIIEGLVEDRIDELLLPCRALVLVSSVPILNLTPPERTRLFTAYERLIDTADCCRIAQYTYAPWLPDERARRLYGDEPRPIWRNVPPAWVWASTHHSPAARHGRLRRRASVPVQV